jgi:Ser/Thr protein kinase RdoA (MazF antagonist)
LQEYPAAQATNLTSVIDENLALLERMLQYFLQPGVRKAMAQKLGIALDDGPFIAGRIMHEIARKESGAQALHMDFVRGNVLFSDEWTGDQSWIALQDRWEPPFVSGIIDFEKAAWGLPVFDIARSLAFLLVDCKYKQPHKVVKYFVQSGYQKRGGQPLDTGGGGHQLEFLKPLVRFYLLHDFYKFLKHNPYESLPQNEHFVRTRDFMRKDGIIKATN